MRQQESVREGIAAPRNSNWEIGLQKNHWPRIGEVDTSEVANGGGVGFSSGKKKAPTIYTKRSGKV